MTTPSIEDFEARNRRGLKKLRKYRRAYLATGQEPMNQVQEQYKTLIDLEKSHPYQFDRWEMTSLKTFLQEKRKAGKQNETFEDVYAEFNAWTLEHTPSGVWYDHRYFCLSDPNEAFHFKMRWY